MKAPIRIDKARARRLWLHATRLDSEAPFGAGPAATKAATEHLGYVQIDTIHVIERAHHHILFSRIPEYRRSDLAAAQSAERAVFEYWTHALSYVPTRDIRFFLDEMAQHKTAPSGWFSGCTPDELRRLIGKIRKEGPLSIRDFGENEKVEKDHPWASRNPSKRVLELGFYNGDLAISRRDGMVKTYELLDRHFGWSRRPRPASADAKAEYLLDRAVRAQGLVSSGSVMYPYLTWSEPVAALLERRLKRKALVAVAVDELDTPFFAEPALLATDLPELDPARAHILSPFDPLIIQRKRLQALFDYEHVFEAYVPKAKRQFGYFTLPVLWRDTIVAVLDLKADRMAKRLLIQSWHWVAPETAELRMVIEAALDRFAAFQFRAE